MMQMLPKISKKIPVISFQLVMMIFLSVGSLICLGLILKYRSYGLDVTDEGFYLSWISNPFLYDWSITQFGYIYHPFYTLLSGDIGNLRALNILVTFGLAWALFFVFFRSLTPKLSGTVDLPLLSAGFACSSLMAFGTWLLTPNYNSLNLQGLLITSIGLLLSERGKTWKGFWGSALIGVGGWLTFMAKPSSALALSMIAGFYLLFSRKINFRTCLIATTGALVPLVISALLIDGSISGFINRIRIGLAFASYLGGGHTLSEIIRLDSFGLSRLEIGTASLLGGLVLLSLTPGSRRSESVLSLPISAILFTITFFFAADPPTRLLAFGKFKGLIIWGPIIAMVLYVMRLHDSNAPSRRWADPLILCLLFVLMPYVYAFGTGVNYWVAASSASVFWLLGCLAFLRNFAQTRGNWRFAIPLAIAVQAATVIIVSSGMHRPYRQPEPIVKNAAIVEIGTPSSLLILSTNHAEYFNELKRSARKAGFERGTPMIDLTGQSPGILFALGAKNIGQAWMIGGYPGSLKLTDAALRRTSCSEISRSWILLEPEGPRKISDEVLNEQGLNLKQDYIAAFSVRTPSGMGGFNFQRQQIFYKPKEQQPNLQSCIKARERAEIESRNPSI